MPSYRSFTFVKHKGWKVKKILTCYVNNVSWCVIVKTSDQKQHISWYFTSNIYFRKLIVLISAMSCSDQPHWSKVKRGKPSCVYTGVYYYFPTIYIYTHTHTRYTITDRLSEFFSSHNVVLPRAFKTIFAILVHMHRTELWNVI